MITPEAQQRLLGLARRALEARVQGRPAPPIETGGALDARCGAFVTIYCGGDLRGCLGRIEPDAPLALTVADLAASVSDSDPRFEPVAFFELPEIEIEISVLAPPTEIHSIEAIEVGRHGLVIEQGLRRGLLLPQVAVEHGWDRETFVAHACRKAALPSDAWRCGARILVFEAHVFGERSPVAGV